MYQQPQSFINRAVNAMNNLALIQTIYDAVIGIYGNSLSIAYPKITSDKNRIYFIIDSSNFDTVTLKGKIKNILGFDYSEDDDGKQDVIILNAQLVTSPNYIASLADDITPFSPQDIEEVQEFLKKHYKQYLEKHQNDGNSLTDEPSKIKNGKNGFWSKNKTSSDLQNNGKDFPSKSALSPSNGDLPTPTKPAV